MLPSGGNMIYPIDGSIIKYYLYIFSVYLKYIFPPSTTTARSYLYMKFIHIYMQCICNINAIWYIWNIYTIYLQYLCNILQYIYATDYSCSFTIRSCNNLKNIHCAAGRERRASGWGPVTGRTAAAYCCTLSHSEGDIDPSLARCKAFLRRRAWERRLFELFCNFN